MTVKCTRCGTEYSGSTYTNRCESVTDRWAYHDWDGHALNVWSQPGPGNRWVSGASCTCGWKSDVTSSREQAQEWGDTHLRCPAHPEPVASPGSDRFW